MDKQLIERIALEVVEEIYHGENQSWRKDGIIAVFATRLLPRIDAERWKEAACVVDFSKQGWRDFIESIRVLPDGTPLFLSPTIPEGMALVPIEPTQAMSEAALNTFIRTSSHEEEIDVDVIYKAMLAAAQGERNAY